MQFTRKFYRLNETTETWEETYTQPIAGWLKFKVYNALLTIIYFRPFRPVLEAINGVSAWHHNRNCNNDCVEGKVRNETTGVMEPQLLCGWFPLEATLDLKHYELDTKNSVTLKTRRLS